MKSKTSDLKESGVFLYKENPAFNGGVPFCCIKKTCIKCGSLLALCTYSYSFSNAAILSHGKPTTLS